MCFMWNGSADPATVNGEPQALQQRRSSHQEAIVLCLRVECTLNLYRRNAGALCDPGSPFRRVETTQRWMTPEPGPFHALPGDPGKAAAAAVSPLKVRQGMEMGKQIPASWLGGRQQGTEPCT